MLPKHHSKNNMLYCMVTTHLMPKQHLKTKYPIININNWLNKEFFLVVFLLSQLIKKTLKL